jgi:3-oxoacyl-[acyl-carrier protein] reductase
MSESSTSRVALVTGASRGIGRAVALRLAAAGHRVAVCYARDADGAKETQAAVEELGASAISVQADVADPASVDAAFSEIESTWGPVELLVNNAGVTADGLLMRMSDEQWDTVLRTNLTGAFQTIRRATPKMMKGRYGRIVNVSSVSGLSGQAGQANYSASKAGLVGLTRAVARELASRGITCNVVAPGPIVTAMTDGLPAEWHTEVKSNVPLGRLGTPEEVAAAVAFLCTEDAGYVTGAVVPVDGGLGMGH